MTQSKVFVIGFEKTGTTSMGKALELLGYNVCGSVVGRESSLDIIRKKAYSKLPLYDAFQDNPWCFLYKELDLSCPNSKFILTIRPTQEWIISVINHFGTTKYPYASMLYGAPFPLGNENIYIERYERHNAEVLQYFENRTNDILVLQTGIDFSWKKICAFLDKDIPERDFPYLNASRFPLKKIKPFVVFKNFLLRK